ncbi:hypothetical protein [Streptomyces stelliscabiei]|uniref:hypothetical protein n=1 Tax=Streptomyces stelliscabiei TaxID=146820 RepID=UPI003A8DF047
MSAVARLDHRALARRPRRRWPIARGDRRPLRHPRLPSWTKPRSTAAAIPASRLHAVAFTGDGEDGQVRIRAEITSDSADNTPVESTVARISMEPAVTSAAWRQMPA